MLRSLLNLIPGIGPLLTAGSGVIDAIAGVIVTFYFGARELAKLRNQKRMALGTEAFGEQQRRIDALRQTQRDAAGAYASEMTDHALEQPLHHRMESSARQPLAAV